MPDEKSQTLEGVPRAADRLSRQDEPPVVARLVVEIRSDGTRTIARGFAEDVTLGQRVQLEAQGATPLALTLSLMKSMGQIPALARAFAQKLLGAKK